MWFDLSWLVGLVCMGLILAVSVNKIFFYAWYDVLKSKKHGLIYQLKYNESSK